MALNRILIAVPTMAGLMKAKTASTLVMLMKRLTRAGVDAEYLNVDSSDIVYARNLYARLVLESDHLDGLLFVDSDMQFRPALVMKMLAQGGDVVGAAYPKRSLDMGQFAKSVAEQGEASDEARRRALALTYQYTVVPSWVKPQIDRMRIVRGFAKMAAVGMGCTLVSRAALQAMIDGGVVERRKDIIDGVEQIGWNFFDSVKVGDVTLSEDYSFCYRWTRMLKRDLWVCVDEPITHLGDFAHQARYLDRLVLLQQESAPDGAPPPPEGPPSIVHVSVDEVIEGES